MQEQPKDEPNAQAQTCPKCGGNMLERGMIGPSFTRYLGDVPFGNRHTSNMGAYVCDNCGYAEIYATNPEKLRG